MTGRVAATPERLVRLAAELAENGLDLDPADVTDAAILTEIDYSMRPRVHERRVPSYGVFVAPTVPTAAWEAPTTLSVTELPFADHDLDQSRPFADGLASWLSMCPGGAESSIVFDRPAGSERDLVVLAEVSGATIVQRHPSGVVRVIGAHGVMRNDGYDWHLEPPLQPWIDTVACCELDVHRPVLAKLLSFAVHDLGARGIGATLIHRPNDDHDPDFERRLATPPPLEITRPSHLAPLTHVLTQVDGAAVFDADGVLRELGVRLIPSPEAEADVPATGGMRHISARRFSYDDPDATVIVVSEDGPVTVMRSGEVRGSSAPGQPTFGQVAADRPRPAA